MAYDKTSFLAGVAVGRNMESWPAQEGADYFRFVVSVSAGGFYSPWIVFNGTIDWGDGSVPTAFNNITTNPNYHGDYNEAARGRAYHTYSSAGTYTITMTGDLRDWSVMQNAAGVAANTYLISVLTPFPGSMSQRRNFNRTFRGSRALVSLPGGLFCRCGIENANYLLYQCSSLQRLPRNFFLGCDDLTSAQQMCFRCESLSDLDAGLFADAPNILDLFGAFYGCTALQLPHGLLDPLQKLQDGRSLFNRSGALMVPVGFLANNPDVNSLFAMFYMSSVTEAADDFFAYCPDAESLSEVFAYSQLASIPSGKINAPNAKDLTTMFTGTPVRSIPPGILDLCVSAEDLSGIFADTQVSSIPPGLLAHCTNVKSLSGAFRGTPVSSIPPGLLDACVLAEDVSSIFTDTQVSSIPPLLFSRNHNLKAVSGAFARTPITSIPSGIFDNCPLLEELNGCFYGCSAVEGPVPELWNMFPDANGERCFFGCSNASNWGDIPSNWR